ncbi:NUDIX domain-containing protein [Glycomyces paridis]|uniref:NUDIX domain-containing protein n=1 Tax=Glycomyces paridis TaxID=2126555 RepID=UPI0019571162|nr:NUDIX hydrolase [Glycomyces paridis]
MNDQTPTVPPLVAAAHAVDERLPAAWARVADYLAVYGDPTGKLGGRKADGDRVAELRAEDLHVVCDALEALLDVDAATAPGADGDLVFYADTDLRALVERTAAEALRKALPESRALILDTDYPNAAAAVVAAVWGPIERAAFVAAATVGREEAARHDAGCHGRIAATDIADEILLGDDGTERPHKPCKAPPSSTVDDLALMLDEVLFHVTPLPAHTRYQSRLAPEALAQTAATVATATAKARPAVAYTADLVWIWGDHVAMVRRGPGVYAGHLALPGGHVEPDETSLAAAVREAGEEIGIGLNPAKLIQVPKVFDAPGRDPRGRVVSVAYTTRSSAPTDGIRLALRAGDDAAEALWVPTRDVIRAGVLPVAFDHRVIVMAALEALGEREFATASADEVATGGIVINVDPVAHAGSVDEAFAAGRAAMLRDLHRRGGLR